jgi:hypothetical protein
MSWQGYSRYAQGDIGPWSRLFRYALGGTGPVRTMSAPAARVSIGISPGHLLIIGVRQCAGDNGDGLLETTPPREEVAC